MQISYHPRAAAELVKEVRYYDERSPGLGRAFTEEVDGAVQRIATSPLRFAPGPHNTRHGPLVRFPHRIVYRIEGETLRVYAVAHPKRQPSYWLERLGADAE